MDQIPVLIVEIWDCRTGYAYVALIPIIALSPRAILMTYAGIPSDSKAAVIKLPKLPKE